MSTLKSLDQQVMVITGASSGIGLTMVQWAAKLGARRVLVARSEETLRETVESIEVAAGEAITVVADVASRESVEGGRRRRRRSLGGLTPR